MAYYSFGGWKDSLFGDKHVHGPEGVALLHPRQGRDLAVAPAGAGQRRQPPLPDLELMTALELLTVGRVGVDLYPEQSGVPLKDVATFAKSLGGTATNVAVGAARLGHRSAVLTKVGPDGFGDYVREALTGFGVDASYVGTAAGCRRRWCSASSSPPEDPPLTFYRAPIAPDLTITPDDVPWDVVEEVPVLWVTGTGVSVEPARTTQLDILARRGRPAPGSGRWTILDLDWRRDVLALARRGPRGVRRDARPRHRHRRQPGRGRGGGRHAATRTRPPPGCSPGASSWPWSRWAARASWSRPPDGPRSVPPHPVEVVCGLGAGDAFGGALVHGLLSGWDPARMRRVRQRRRRNRRLSTGLRRRHAHRGRARRHGISTPRSPARCRPGPRHPVRRPVARPARDPRRRARRRRRGVRRAPPPRPDPQRPRHPVPGRGRPPGSRRPGLRWRPDGDGGPALAAGPPGRGAQPPGRGRRARHARRRRGAAAPRRPRGQGRHRLDEPGRPRRRDLDDGRPVHRLRRREHRRVRPRGRQDAAAHRRRRHRHRRDPRGLRGGGHRARGPRADRDGRAAALPPRGRRVAAAAQGCRVAVPRSGHRERARAQRAPTPG